MKKSDDNRRGFLGKMLIGASTLVALPFIASGTKKSENEKQEEETMEHPVKQVRALGFQWETRDPFLFCVHHEDKFPKGNDVMGPDPSYLQGRHMGQDFIVKDGFRMYHGQTVPGFPGHPHRGFETITYMINGNFRHKDSAGNEGYLTDGGVQWMTAGKGVVHSEMPEQKEGLVRGFQLWLNLPKKKKMIDPSYNDIQAKDIYIKSTAKIKGNIRYQNIDIQNGSIINADLFYSS